MIDLLKHCLRSENKQTNKQNQVVSFLRAVDVLFVANIVNRQQIEVGEQKRTMTGVKRMYLKAARDSDALGKRDDDSLSSL